MVRMTHPRRWDTDRVGHGLAGAPDIADDAARLAEVLRWPDWIAEDPETHLVPHIERVCTEPGSDVSLAGWSVDGDGTLVVRLRTSEPAVDRRTWRTLALGVVAAIAETRLLVREDPTTQVLDVVTGVLDGDTDFAAHGHRLRIEPVTTS